MLFAVLRLASTQHVCPRVKDTDKVYFDGKWRQFKAFVDEGQLTADLRNPFRIGIGGDRAAVIAKYETWLRRQHHLLRALSEATGLVRAIGTAIHVRRQIATGEGRLVDSRDRLLAHATTTCLLFSLSATPVPTESE